MPHYPYRTIRVNPRTARLEATAAGVLVAISIWVIVITLSPIPVSDIARVIGAVVATCIGAIVAMSRYRAVLWSLLGLSVLAFMIIGFSSLVRPLVRTAVRWDRPPQQPVDAVVVLSASITGDSFLNQEGLDRLLSGLALIRRGASGTLVLTRVHVPPRPSGRTAEGDQRRLTALLPGGTTVYIVDNVTSTREEAVKTAALAAQHGWTRIALVTSPIHTVRACATFEHVGLRVWCVPSESRDIAINTLATMQDRIRAWKAGVYEVLATLQYRQEGWID